MVSKMNNKEDKGLTSVKDIMASYFLAKSEGKDFKNLEPWQIWFFEFCEKYSIENRKDIASLLSLVSRYRNALTWWRWLEGYLSDYPNLKTPPTGLVFFLFKKAKDEGTFDKVAVWEADPEKKIYKKVRKDIKKFKSKDPHYTTLNNSELINEYVKYHETLAERYERSQRDSADRLRQLHVNLINYVQKFYDRLKRGSYQV